MNSLNDFRIKVSYWLTEEGKKCSIFDLDFLKLAQGIIGKQKKAGISSRLLGWLDTI